MLIVGALSVLFMGLVLGILGGGGSILTVPILTYFFDIPASLATGYSLFIVGATSLLAAYAYSKQGLLDYKIGVLFAPPSLLGVFVARKYILPAIPDSSHLAGSFFTKDQIILVSFAVLVLIIAVFMFKTKESESHTDAPSKTPPYQALWIAIEGITVGLITGFVGAGGGFMIVPALTLLGGISLRKAIATSLFIISIKSLFGFTVDLSEGVSFDPILLSSISAITILGSLAGAKLSTHLPTHTLRKGFAYFVLVMGILILAKELL